VTPPPRLLALQVAQQTVHPIRKILQISGRSISNAKSIGNASFRWPVSFVVNESHNVVRQYHNVVNESHNAVNESHNAVNESHNAVRQYHNVVSEYHNVGNESHLLGNEAIKPGKQSRDGSQE
jgi:hypothetical protein